LIIINPELVSKITWEQDPDHFDVRLHRLGRYDVSEEFIVVNPLYDESILEQIDTSLSAEHCVVWANRDIWIAKKFTRSWQPANGWQVIQCELKFDIAVECNPDLNNFVQDVDIHIDYPSLEHVWYLDPAYNPTDSKIWVCRASVKNNKITGTRDMGYVAPRNLGDCIIEFNPDMPELTWADENNNIIDFDQFKQDIHYTHQWVIDSQFNFQDYAVWAVRISPSRPNPLGIKHMGTIRPLMRFNPDIPRVAWPLDNKIPYYELFYDHVWYLDKQFNTEADDIWVARIVSEDSLGVKNMGYIAPPIEFNPAIPKVAWAINDQIPYYDLNYDHVWHLDTRFNPLDDKIWVARIAGANSIGVKNMGYIMPRVEFNPAIPDLNYVIEQGVPYYDFDYKLMWMLDNSLHTDDHAIWAARITPLAEPAGVKVVGNIGIEIEKFDVVFISYKEPNAEANWYRVQEKCPTAKRVRGVTGIFEAHKRAAEIAETAMFYVVDGDAELLDNFSFNFKPNIFDMDCVHLWTSRNPVNGLEYGYGGVKLFPRQLLLDATTWNVDLTTGLGKLKLVDKVSNMTAFNTDAFNTWRSAFRECAKLAASDDPAAEERLTTWCNHAVGEFKFEALCGAQAGRMHGSSSQFDLGRLKAINDYEWMKNEFNKFYGQ